MRVNEPLSIDDEAIAYLDPEAIPKCNSHLFVSEEFDKNNVTYLKADWTNRNPQIAAQIEKYNRSGIPLYIFWNERLDEPMVLNEILTEGYLMEVINEN